MTIGSGNIDMDMSVTNMFSFQLQKTHIQDQIYKEEKVFRRESKE